MSRTARIKSSTGIYHIITRGINQQNIFSSDDDYERLLSTLARYCRKSKSEIYAYCLMDNHIHLLLKEGQESIATTMKKIGTSYVYYYNWQYNRKGHLFQDRYKSEPVEDDAYFLTVLRYIHQNPVKAGITDDPATYPWSSYTEYTDKVKLVNTSFTLKLFNQDQEKAIEEFISFL
jgi:REP element-mobilizing transposase RayT